MDGLVALSSSRMSFAIPHTVVGHMMSARYFVTEAERRQGAVIEVPWVAEMALSAYSGDCPVFGSFDSDVAEDKQRYVLVIACVANSVGCEDNLSPMIRTEVL